MGPLISCVIPVLNGERFVAEAIESIFAQTYRPIELIVCDDGSTDGTGTILSGYGDRIRVMTQTIAGPSAARNLGLHAAHGEFVAFLDADDLWAPHKLTRQMEFFAAKPELKACVTHVQMIWGDGMREEAEQYRDHPRAAAVPGYATITLLARRCVFNLVGDFDSSLWFSDATDWFLRARELGVAMEVVPEVLVFHRMHENNHTRRRSAASREEFVRTVKASLDRRRQRAR